MEAKKVEILSKQIIKPSSPTPDHLKECKLSFIDQIFAPTLHVPIMLFYSASDISAFLASGNFKTISDKLKASLSETLTLYYPFCGRVKNNLSVECNDEGVLYVESKVSTNLSIILNNPQVHELIELFPFNPYNPGPSEVEFNLAVQLNEFACGGIGLCLCFWHKVADGQTISSFIHAWAKVARGHGNIIVAPPKLDAPLIFPPENSASDFTQEDYDLHENIVTKRFTFDKESLSKLREKLGGFNPTRVEAVTALIWKVAMEARKASSTEHASAQSAMSHAVNIRSRMIPPLSKETSGNLWLQAFSSTVKLDQEVGLLDSAKIVRETIQKFDADYLRKIQGADGFVNVFELLKEAGMLLTDKNNSCYFFSSWTKFGFYEVDFGWGSPSWMCTISVPLKNVVILVATKDEDGIEAWVNLTNSEMAAFQHNTELLQFAKV